MRRAAAPSGSGLTLSEEGGTKGPQAQEEKLVWKLNYSRARQAFSTATPDVFLSRTSAIFGYVR